MELGMLLGLLSPLIGFITLVAFGHKISRTLAGGIACTTVGVSLITFAILLMNYAQSNAQSINLDLYTWVPLSGVDTRFTLHLDPLTILMTLIISGVGFLIHVYSMGYMDHEKDYARYFACLNFFIFSMLLLVLAGNLLVLFLGWEGVGLASYLLIGFYYERPKAAQAATKAFVVNRIGDLGLLLGIILTYYLFGTSDIEAISQRVGNEFSQGAPILTVLTLLFFLGAVGKSAQLPLHIWLPDAMEGPTPVSALIHAATMVTAGVYLVVRMHFLFMMAPITMYVIGFIAGTTALFAALCAAGQMDLKRVLAYSTVSQLGFMFLACSVGAFYAAMFHLTMHAFIKGLLFLAAGNVVHMMEGTTDMQKMGGLRRNFPYTHCFFFIGVLALSGIPPVGAFFSKELILEEEYVSGVPALFYMALAASVLTAFYLTRAYCLTFLGPYRGEESSMKKVKEAPYVMIVPVGLLTLLSIFGGFMGFSLSNHPLLEGYLSELGITITESEFSRQFLEHTETWVAIFGCLGGVIVAFVIYTKFVDKLRATLSILRKAFYVDEIYDCLVIIPIKSCANLIAHWVEPHVFEGSIRVSYSATQKTAALLQKVQSGQIRSYAAWMILGSVFLIAYLIF